MWKRTLTSESHFCILARFAGKIFSELELNYISDDEPVDLPFTKELFDGHRKNKVTNKLCFLINIFGSLEKFIHEYKTMICRRFLISGSEIFSIYLEVRLEKGVVFFQKSYN